MSDKNTPLKIAARLEAMDKGDQMYADFVKHAPWDIRDLLADRKSLLEERTRLKDRLAKQQKKSQELNKKIMNMNEDFWAW